MIGDDAFKVTAPAFTAAEGFESPAFTVPVNTFKALLRDTVFPLPAEIVVEPVTLTTPDRFARLLILRLFTNLIKIS